MNEDRRGRINYEPADIDRLSSSLSNTTSLEDSCMKAVLLKAELEENVMTSMNHHPKSLNFFKCRDVCLNARCMRAALEIQRNLNQFYGDPCKDFYTFACGGWIIRHIDPTKYFGSTVASELEADHSHKLRVLLEKELSRKEPDFIRTVKEMYDSCMDLERIENVNSQPLTEVLKTLGGWPVVKGKHWNECTLDWIDILILIRNMGYSHDIPMELSVVKGDGELPFMILLDQPSLGMPDRDFLMNLKDPSRTDYFKLMVRAANKLGANEYKSEQELREVLNFETKLANLSLIRMEREKMEVATKRKITIQDLMNMAEEIDWLKYFNGLLNDEVNESTTLLINNQDLINKSIHLFSETNQRVVVNYIVWKVVEESLPLLSEEWRKLGEEFPILAGGDQTPRHEKCLLIFTQFDTLGVALSSYYVRHYFKDDNYTDVLEVAEYIHQEVLNILENTNSMDEETKNKIIEKVEAITYHIGYPKELLNDSIISDLYSNLMLNNESYFENVLKVRKWYTDSSFSLLRKPRTNDEWKINADATRANAFYRKWRNSIDILGGLLKFPFFENRRPSYLNFGTIGFLLGHELMHGLNFIVQNVGNSTYYTDEGYRKKAQCIKEQYGNYTDDTGSKLNAVKTLSENIADNGAMKIAYLAYQRWVRDHKIEYDLPGLDYTKNQLFWISAAQSGVGWYLASTSAELKKFLHYLYIYCRHAKNSGLCQSLEPYYIWQYTREAKFPPFMFRVIGAMSNIPEFSKDFNCAQGSLMNPINKCEVF